MHTEKLIGRPINHNLVILGHEGKKGKISEEALLRLREGLVEVLKGFEGRGVQLATDFLVQQRKKFSVLVNWLFMGPIVVSMRILFYFPYLGSFLGCLGGVVGPKTAVWFLR